MNLENLLFSLMQQDHPYRNGSRDRRLEGPELRLNFINEAMPHDVTSLEQSITFSIRFHWRWRLNTVDHLRRST
ncbi:hypothetical protein F4777DRAFT_531440 [Nemania sp. FL0916]|nr:hypothetical protein F4777DRAFT_531440 [Nemania sp. FL0916]